MSEVARSVTDFEPSSPYKFEAPWHAFEFAYHILNSYSNLVILTMAWMTREDGRAYSRTPHEPDLETLTYWITRLEPLIRSDNEDEIIIVFCNRTGTEGDATYAGTSAVLGIKDGEVRVYGMLGRGEKSLLIVDTNNPPRAKMVYRPEGEDEEVEAPPTADNHIPDLSSDNLSYRDEIDLQAPSTVRGHSNKHKPPPSPRPSAPPPAPPRESSSRSRHSETRRPSSSISNRHDLSIQTAPPKKDDDGGIPTPSAPSPTPMAMRPRLHIPESAKSPPVVPLDDYSEPPSAISLRSHTSSMSNNSYMSRASESTVRSLTRPPEDSTPYPHSGIIPDRSNPFSPDKEKKIYSGTVSFDASNDPRQENQHRRPYWSPSPQSPEAFIWPPVGLGSSHGDGAETAVSWDHVRKRDTSSARSEERKLAARKSGYSQYSDGTAKFFSKATPPGSRSVSRNRARHSGIDTGMMDPAVAFAHHTAHLIPGADTAERIRAITGTDSPIPERPSSPKSRNASRSRPTASPELQRSHSSSIPIFASPSLIGMGGNTSAEDVVRGRALESREDTMASEEMRRPSLPGSMPSGTSAGSAGGRPLSRQLPSRPDRRPSQGQRRTSSTNHPDFERVEEVVHVNCPVHGRGSRAGSVTDLPTALPPSPPPLRPATLPLRTATPMDEPKTRD